MKFRQRNEQGFSLLETLVVLPVAALIGFAVVGGIAQVIQSGRNSERMAALRQVQVAGYWLSQDGVQAQRVVTCSGSGFPIILSWTDWDDGEFHEVEYSLQSAVPSSGLCYLQRKEILNGQSDKAVISVVAQYLELAETSCTPSGRRLNASETLVLTVTARVNRCTETRRYEIKPRALF